MGFLFLALFAIAFILVITGKIMFIVAAFRTSVVWGLCVIFLQGIADFIFLIMHWEEAKKAFGIQIIGVLLGFAVIMSGSMSSVGNSAGMEKLAQRLAESGIAEAQLESLQEVAEEHLDEVTVTRLPGSHDGTQSDRSAEDPKSLEGATLSEAKQVLGRPKGEMESGGEICWLYDTFTVFSADGQTVSHVELGDGQKRPPFSGKRAKRKASPNTTSQARAVRIIANGGKQVDLKHVIVPGKVTLVDFYADWCGPCRRMGPQLEQIARTEADVVLCKIDIVNWKTPVVKQFGIQSIPHVRVYNKEGLAVGSPTSNFSEIRQNITRAR